MLKITVAALLLLPSFGGQVFAASHSAPLGCTSTIMCCIPGKGCFSPNTPIGYSCNGGHAQVVNQCKRPSKP